MGNRKSFLIKSCCNAGGSIGGYMMKKSLIILAVVCVIAIIIFIAVASCLDEDLEYSLPDEHADYTIMVYLNGSDLESECGMATDDVIEIVSADFPRERINVVIQTGGTEQWQNEYFPAESLARYLVIDDDLELLEEVPAESMGESETLSEFINYCMENFPAEKFGLIMWDHGGGAVSGFGVDELFEYDVLTLAEMNEAFENTHLSGYPLEFLGFDACLMATVETAYMAKDYARYLVASEELEPGYGWDYETWLSNLGQNPRMTGAEVGQVIADSFVEFYINNDMEDEPTTLSVIDLTEVEAVVKALEGLIEVADISSVNYQAIAKSRSRTREFGMPSEYGGSTDMVDIVHLAEQFMDICPDEAAALIAAINNAVVHNALGKFVDNASGLSLYFPYSAKEEVDERIDVYRSCGFSPRYIDYVAEFAAILTGTPLADLDVSDITPEQDESYFDIVISPEELANIESIYFTAWVKEEDGYYTQIYEDSYVEIDESGKILTEFDGIITTINGEWACLYEIESGEDYIRYAVPAYLNGQDVNLIVLYDGLNPEGKVIGAMPLYDPETGMAPKQMIKIRDGDVIELFYYAERFIDIDDDSEPSDDDAIWYEGNEFTVDGELLIENWEVLEGIYLYGFTIVDLQGNVYYTDFIEVEFVEEY